jgi:hypothetical protein
LTVPPSASSQTIPQNLVTREQLALVETPVETGSFKPVPHIELITTLEHVLQLNHHALPLPNLLCPGCGVNILEAGFHNTCSETISLREDNFTCIVTDRLYIDHDEKGHKTVNHECDMNAYCGSCDKLLPWPIYEMRELDGGLREAAILAAELMSADDSTGGNA